MRGNLMTAQSAEFVDSARAGNGSPSGHAARGKGAIGVSEAIEFHVSGTNRPGREYRERPMLGKRSGS